MKRSHSRVAISALLALGLAGCSRPKASRSATPPVAPFAAPGQLTATLIDPSSIGLAWKHNASESVGYWVEFTTPEADFVKLDVAWPPTTTFRHPDVAPATTFIYRIVPFFGRPSTVVAMRTGPAPAGEHPSESEGPLEDPGFGPAPGAPVAKKSLRTTSTIADAAPTNLTVAQSSPTSADLRWEDRAADEDGYLVELAQDPSGFKVVAVLPPNATSFRKIALPSQTLLHYRVRAFFHGEPSRLVSVTTPPEAPPDRLVNRPR